MWTTFCNHIPILNLLFFFPFTCLCISVIYFWDILQNDIDHMSMFTFSASSRPDVKIDHSYTDVFNTFLVVNVVRISIKLLFRLGHWESKINSKFMDLIWICIPRLSKVFSQQGYIVRYWTSPWLQNETIEKWSNRIDNRSWQWYKKGCLLWKRKK